ncbi:hypothetical protein BKA62DRAFT_668873 [Auriculariales sp. MPI-PUGE-AT-0066]|nr:hypothetical protein BKA62DRAFT_668873 [Auriculariales sp. MPI-PUGE-AT-0066]
MAIPLGSNFPPPAVSLANRAPLSEAVVQLQRSVQVLEATVDIFRLRRTVSKEAKEFSKLLVATSKRLAAAVAAACVQRHEDLHVLAKAYITVAQESIDESILMIRRRVASGPIENLKLRSDTTAKVRSFMLGVQALEEMLKIKHGVARLISDPARRLGLSNAKPQLDLFTLSTSRVVSEGFKVVALGMANMTDGAPWPWKAIPLTILHFANMIEVAFFRSTAQDSDSFRQD